jgi:hypothetical protein
MIEPEKSAAPNPLSDPNAMEGMMDGMKKQVVMMVPNFAIMAWVRPGAALQSAGLPACP